MMDEQPSAYPDEFVDAAVLGQTGVDVALGVDADAVHMAARHLGQHLALGVTDGAVGGIAAIFLLGDVVIAVLAAADVVGSAHAGSLAQILAFRREKLNALV